MTMSGSRPHSPVSSNRAGSTYSRRSRTARESAARRPPLQAGRVPGGVSGRNEHNHQHRGQLAVDGRQLLSQVFSPQFDLLIGVTKAAHSPAPSAHGDPLNAYPLRVDERQR
jgi:hypothetical protein